MCHAMFYNMFRHIEHISETVIGPCMYKFVINRCFTCAQFGAFFSDDNNFHVTTLVSFCRQNNSVLVYRSRFLKMSLVVFLIFHGFQFFQVLQIQENHWLWGLADFIWALNHYWWSSMHFFLGKILQGMH